MSSRHEQGGTRWHDIEPEVMPGWKKIWRALRQRVLNRRNSLIKLLAGNSTVMLNANIRNDGMVECRGHAYIEGCVFGPLEVLK